MKKIFKRKQKQQQLDNKIDFADKYIYGNNYSDKFDKFRQKDQPRKKVDKEKFKHLGFASLIAFCSVVAFCFGYFLISVNMERKAYVPQTSPTTIDDPQSPPSDDAPTINDSAVQLVSSPISSDYFDAGEMINAVVERAVNGQYNSVSFDMKRQSGSLAYNSKLVLAETFQAVSSPGLDVETSVKLLLENNIIPIATIYCFSDNTAPLKDSNVAVKKADGSVWTDKSGNAWLNPYSEVAVNYLVSVVKEISEMGIKNIVLEGVSFPSGDLSTAVFDEGVSQPEQSKLDEFVAKVKASVPSDCRVSVASHFEFNTPEEFQAVLPNIKEITGKLPILKSSMVPTDALKLLAEAGIGNYIITINTQVENTETTEN